MIIGAKREDNLPPLIREQQMNRYRAEILGRVPNGLTHNDVFASFLSMMNEADSEARVTKRRLAGSMISLIVTFKSEDPDSAERAVRYAASGVTNFSADVIGPYLQK